MCRGTGLQTVQCDTIHRTMIIRHTWAIGHFIQRSSGSSGSSISLVYIYIQKSPKDQKVAKTWGIFDTFCEHVKFMFVSFTQCNKQKICLSHYLSAKN